MAKFQGGGKPNMAALMKQAQKMQEEMAKAQQELTTMHFEGSAGGGAVKITMSGEREVTNVEIDPELMNAEEIDMLSDLIAAAFNDANSQFEKASAERIGGVTGGLNIPGF